MMIDAVEGGTSDCYTSGEAIVFNGNQNSSASNDIYIEPAIFPNPSTGFLNITGVKELTNIRVTNHLGKVLLQTELSENGILDLTQFSPGTYFISMETPTGVYTEQLFISK